MSLNCKHIVCFGFKECQKHTPSPQPEMPEKMRPMRVSLFLGDTEYRLTMDELRKVLAAQGLTIVGPAERAVLDAMAAIPDGTLRVLLELNVITFSSSVLDALKAELALRAAKEGT
jgi:hypothetical protein